MQKLFLLGAIFMMMSCSTGVNNSTNSTTNDSIKTDTTVIDSSAIDSTVCPD